MPIDPQDPPQDQNQTPADSPSAAEILASLFGQIAGPTPVSDNSAPQAPQVTPGQSPAPSAAQPGKPKETDPFSNLFRAGTGVSQQPSPIDAPDLAQFNREYNTPGSAYHVSPAKRILQSFLTGIMAGPGALADAGFNPARQQKYEQWKTDQQRIMEAAHWNSLYNQKVMHEDQVNARAEQRQQLQRDQMTMKDAEFQQRYGISKGQLQLAQQKLGFYQQIQTKKLNNQQLTQEEKILSAAYPHAMEQAQAQFLTTHPGSTLENAQNDPTVLHQAAQLFEQMKPQATFNDAVMTARAKGELEGVDFSNPAAVYQALQNSKTLSKDQKDAVASVMLPQMMTQGNALQKIDESNKGKLDATALANQGKMDVAKETTNRPSKQMMYIPQPDGSYQSFEVRGSGVNVPGNALTGSGVNTRNNPTAATRGAGEQGTIIQAAGQHLIDVINQNRDKFGNMAAVWNSLKNNSPLADKETSYIKAQLGSFAALNPRMHGFRGQQVYQEFEKLIGGVPKNPEALIGAIQGIMDTAGTVAAVGNPKAAQAQKAVEHWGRDKSGKLVKQ
jgi:hypothetical protein